MKTRVPHKKWCTKKQRRNAEHEDHLLFHTSVFSRSTSTEQLQEANLSVAGLKQT